LKPSGMRGHLPSSELLHRPQGAPAAPQPRALAPFHGLAMWASHTHPVPSQRGHLAVIDQPLSFSRVAFIVGNGQPSFRARLVTETAERLRAALARRALTPFAARARSRSSSSAVHCFEIRRTSVPEDNSAQREDSGVDPDRHGSTLF
jgi:hypothetical protein